MSVSTDPTYPLFQVLSFLGFILSIIPLPWHIQAWNSGTCAFMIWTALACLNSFINSIIWAGNVSNPAPVWCDISSKFIIGVSVGIPAATLCISRRLYYLTAGNTVSITRDDKRRMIIIDLCIAVGMPAIIMILHYIVQGHRFDIIEDVGCYPVVYNTLPAYFLYFMWTPIFGCISLIFSSMTLRSFWRRRAQFNQLISRNSSMSISRYLRLVCLALVDIMCTTPLGIYSIYIGNKGVTLAPWISWEDTHFNFSRVGLVPSLIWRSNSSYRISMLLSQWLPVVCAFLFFALFGFAAEAQKHYKLAFWAVMKRFGVKPAPPKKSSAFKSFSWNTPKSNSPHSLKLDSPPPPYNPKSQPSPSSAISTSKKLDRGESFSSTTEYELGTYTTKDANYTSSVVDIEKFAGLASPTNSDANSTTVYGSDNAPMYHIRPQIDSLARASVDELTFLPSPASPVSAFGLQQLTPSAEPTHPPSLTSSLPLPTTSTSVPASGLAPQHQAKPKTSNSSIRTFLSIDRDRFYIHPLRKLSGDSDSLSPFPTTPPPFVDTAVSASTAASEMAGCGRQVIQVMVHKTETTTSESL